ncbi:MAG: MBOAT family protein, partial [Turicibacter sp.]|nr:MBOAT family protein [Turicibacter sp.]
YFGMIISLEKAFLLSWLNKLPFFIRHIYTLILIIISWGLFAFDSLIDLKAYFKVMFGLEEIPLCNHTTLYYLTSNGILLIILVLASTPIMKVIHQKLSLWKYYLVIEGFMTPLICLIILILSTAYLVDSSYNPFLYFRF